VFVQDIEHLLHGHGDGIVAGEAVVFEEGVEDGLGDEVLGEHLDDFAIGDGVVEVVAEFVGEGLEGGDFLGEERSFSASGSETIWVMREMWVLAILAMSLAQSSQWLRLPHFFTTLA
jgi:hypothetical protein